jgi:hypothetical protein
LFQNRLKFFCALLKEFFQLYHFLNSLSGHFWS